MKKKERWANTLARRPVDHVPCHESVWADTVKKWTAEGRLREGEDLTEHFDMDLRTGGWLNSMVDPDFKPVTIEETEETILQLDGNGAKLRRHKLHASTPEHVDFRVKDRATWEEHARPKLLDLDRRRIPFESYREARKKAAANGEFFAWAGVAPFEQMHPLCGHEFMLMGMALDADWVKDMVMTYAGMTLRHVETLFAEEGYPDGMFFFEDMGFKLKPFMSPAMYREIMQPGHAKLFGFAHAHGMKVMVHSCGFVEPLLPGLIEAGLDCLQAMEVKAGMDLPRLFRLFGDRIAFFGGIDSRVLISNDRARIDAEMDAKILPVLQGGGGYILHSDHSIPPEVEYGTLKYFQDRGREMSRKARRR